MDHIAIHHGEARVAPLWLEVPVYAPEMEYDRGAFFGYLRRIDWTVQDILDGQTSRKPRHTIHAVLQTWTYFGMLSELTGDQVAVRDLSVSRDGKTILQTDHLTALLNKWISRSLKKSVAIRDQEAAHVSECLVTISTVYDSLYTKNPHFLDPEFHLSVQLLYEYIVKAATLAEGSARSAPIQFRGLLGPVRFCQRSMEQLQWCPSDVHMLSEALSATELMFASMLVPPGQDKDHSKCSSTKCLAYQVSDQKEYVTKHTHDACTCEFVFASQKQVAQVLLQDTLSVPLIGASEPVRGEDGQLYVEILASNLSSEPVRYVAISHIWSDGLGNNSSNAVPLCQFHRIAAMVEAIYGRFKVAFWFDTLCFPLQPPAAYDTALVRMRQSYEDADKVLVLDRYLFKQDCQGIAAEEIAMRVTCAPWNRRLWTLQEGMLARSLHFQFRDQSFDLSHWVNRHNEGRTTLEKLVFSSTWRNYASLRVFETQTSRKMNVIQAKKALAFRSTSCSDDEPLCLGNLLGIDPKRVVKARSRTERMKLIWSSVPEHFASTIFWSSAKLDSDGYGWAAASFMADGCGSVRTCSECASWNAESGLSVALPGVLFHRSSLTTRRSFRLIVADNMYFIVQWERLWKPETSTFPCTIESHGPEGFAILLNKSLASDAEERGDVAFFAQACEVLKVVDGGFRVKIVGRVRVYRLEHLKHHPDALLPEDKTPDTEFGINIHPQQENTYPGNPEYDANINARAGAIWQSGCNSEVAFGRTISNALWSIQ